jgi:hypothetical protein
MNRNEIWEHSPYFINRHVPHFPAKKSLKVKLNALVSFSSIYFFNKKHILNDDELKNIKRRVNCLHILYITLKLCYKIRIGIFASHELCT